jgi:Uma2 family endonuclease
MNTQTHGRETLDDLMGVEGKAELINGRIVRYMSTGILPHRVTKRIFRRLDDHVESTGVGEANSDNLGYAISPALVSGRQSFSPDVSYYNGPLPSNLMKFVSGPPTFAVEVRSENDYGPAKEREHADKRKDYFFAGTQVVWDVDPIAETVTVYRLPDPSAPVVFHRGETADAEPALPGWVLKVDDIFG